MTRTKTLVARAGGLSIVALALIASVASTGPDPEAVAACHDLVELVCERAVECDPTRDARDCEDDVEDDFGNCDEALAVEGDTEECFDDLEAATCDELFSGDEDKLPRSCEDVKLYFPRS